MNPLSGCSKGYRKCIKNCHMPKKCPSCPYFKECCHRYCLKLPHTSTGDFNAETRRVKVDPLVECIEFILGKHL